MWGEGRSLEPRAAAADGAVAAQGEAYWPRLEEKAAANGAVEES
jgi:hypothetical protein